MRLVKVKQRSGEKTYGKLKVKAVVLNVVECERRENGLTEFKCYQMWSVIEEWDMEDFDKVAAKVI